jgi:hypothetical protein
LLGLARLTLAAPGSSIVRAAYPAQRTVRLGIVSPDSASVPLRAVNAFSDRMRELGYIEGENLVIESRWAEGRLDQLPGLMAEVLGRKIELLFNSSVIHASVALI